MSVCRTDAFGRLANGAIVWCAGRDSNAHILRSERSDSCQLVYRRMVPAPRNRTRDLLLTRQLLYR